MVVLSLFGSPGTLVENNTIWVVNVGHHLSCDFPGDLLLCQKTLLGGINMVDVTPWGGNYSGTVVRNNTIFGGFATDSKSASQKDGENVDDVIVKFVISLNKRVIISHSAAQNRHRHWTPNLVQRPIRRQRQLFGYRPE
jgi:hypothetical protein